MPLWNGATGVSELEISTAPTCTPSLTINPSPELVVPKVPAIQEVLCVMSDGSEQKLHIEDCDTQAQFMNCLEEAMKMNGLNPEELESAHVQFGKGLRDAGGNPTPRCTSSKPEMAWSWKKTLDNVHVWSQGFAAGYLMGRIS